MSGFLLISIIVVLLLGWLLRDYILHMINRFRGVLPGGPAALPFLGTLGINKDAPWEIMTEWAGKYGDLFTFFLGPQLQLVVADAELVRTVLKDPRFEGRPVTNFSRMFKNHALAFSEGTKWKDTRRFAITALKDFGRGSGSNLIESYVQESVRGMLEEVEHTKASASDFRDCMQRCVVNSISSVFCGKFLKSDDPRFDRLTNNVTVIMGSCNTASSLLNVFPWLSLIPPFNVRQTLFAKRMEETVEMITDVVEEHRKHFDPENVRDFIDAYLKEQQRPGVNLNSFSDDQLVYMGVEMYVAGVDGTLAILEWWLLLISSHPEIQSRCQREIDWMISSGDIVSWVDRSKFPYCEATMNEVLRLAVKDPFGLPHRCTEDTQLCGYLIPKDTAVIMNYFGIHFSAKYFPEPWEFRPERFLDNTGKCIGNQNSFPFSTGRRMCSGDNFAKTIIFIATVSLLQRFVFRKSDMRPWTDVKRINAVGVHADKFLVKATSR